MERKLSDILIEISRTKKTGILSIGVKNDSSLFKFYFRDGTIYHVSHGTCKDMDCVNRLDSLSLDKGFFHLGATVNILKPSFPSTDEIVARVRTMDKTIKWASGSTAAKTLEMAADMTEENPPATMDAVEQELINIVGPIAPMLIENAYRAMNIRKGQAVTPPQLMQLIVNISEQLPEEHRDAFLARFK